MNIVHNITKEGPRMTNRTRADHIRAMSDTELAQFLCTADWCGVCDQVREDGTCHALELGGPLNQSCAAGALKWLRQPEEEG